jgi:hypothetical protein
MKVMSCREMDSVLGDGEMSVKYLLDGFFFLFFLTNPDRLQFP